MSARAAAELGDGRITGSANRKPSPGFARKASLRRNRQGSQRAGRDSRAVGQDNLAARAQTGARLRRRRADLRGARRLYPQGRRGLRRHAQPRRGAAPAPGGLLPARAQRRGRCARDPRVSAGTAALGPLAGQIDLPAPADDLQGRNLDREIPARVLRSRHQPAQTAGTQGCRRGYRDARIHDQPRDRQQVRAYSAGNLRAEVFLHLGGEGRQRRGRERRDRQGTDPRNGDGGDSAKSAVGSGDRGDAAGQADQYRAAHGGQVSTGDGNPSVGKSQTDRMTDPGAERNHETTKKRNHEKTKRRKDEKSKMSKIDKQGKRGRATARKVRRAARIADAPATQVTVTFRHVEPTDALRLYA